MAIVVIRLYRNNGCRGLLLKIIYWDFLTARFEIFKLHIRSATGLIINEYLYVFQIMHFRYCSVKPNQVTVQYIRCSAVVQIFTL